MHEVILIKHFILSILLAVYGHHDKAILPDHVFTPGAVDPTLTKEIICDKTHHTSEDRHVTQSTKIKVCLEYGITNGCPGKEYEIDHLVSIELAGSNDIKNLWPQPLDTTDIIGYHMKDVVENRAHAAVCSGKMSLEDAQKGISGDWYQFAIDNNLLQKQ
jgi:hypothetical protein